MDNKRLKQISNQLSKELQNWGFDKAIKYSADETNTRNFLIEPFFEIFNYSKMDGLYCLPVKIARFPPSL